MGTLAPPAYATQVDVFFNDNPVDVITIGGVEDYNPLYPAADYTFHIVWDELNTVDQQRLLDLVDEYGGVVPFGGAVDGFQVVNYGGSVVGGNATGLDTTAAVAGEHTALYRQVKAGGDPTNLPTLNDDGVNERTRFTLDEFPTSEEFFLLSDTTTDYYVWYNTIAAAEVRDAAFTSIPPNGSHFTLSDPSTDYYVNFVNEGDFEITSFDFVGVGGTLTGSEHFILEAGVGTPYYVWFNDSSFEEFTVDVAGNTVAAAGEHWTFNDDVGPFYVWYRNAAIPAAVGIDTTGVDGAALSGGEHFLLNTPSTDYYVWYTVDGVGVDPAPGGTGIQVDILAADTEENVSERTEQAIVASGAFSVEDVTPANEIIVTSLEAGATTGTADVDTGIAVTVIDAGLDAAADPAPGGTGIQVDYTIGDSDELLAGFTFGALNTSGANISWSIVDTVITGVANVATPLTDAADVDSGVTVTVVQQGAVGSPDPAPGGTGIQVSIVGDETDAELAALAEAAMAVGLAGDATTELSGTVVQVTSTDVGDETNAVDVDSGVTVTVVQEGFDNTTANEMAMTVDVVAGTVVSVAITDPGSGYVDGTGFSFLLAATAGGGDGAASISYDVVDGQVTNAAIAAPGATYTDGLTQAVAAADTPDSDDNDPAPGGTRLAVFYNSSETLEDVVATAAGLIGAAIDFDVTQNGNILRIENVNDGAVTPAADVNSGVGLTQVVVGQDASTDPAPGGTGIQVDFDPTAGTSLAQLAEDTKTAMDATLAGLITTVRSGNRLTTEVDIQGPANSAPGVGTSPFEVDILATGVAATPRSFTATVYVNNVANAISIDAANAATFTDLVNELNADLTDATAAIDGNGNVTITADNVGEAIFIVDGDLFKNTQDRLRLDTPVAPDAGTDYALVLEVDGVEQEVVIAGEDAATFTDLVAALTAAITGGDASIDGNGNIALETDTAGGDDTSFGSIKVIRDGLFPNTDGFRGYGIARPGSNDFVDLLFNGEDLGGDMHFFKYAMRGIGTKPPVGNTYNNSTAVYYNGADWVRVIDDAPA